MPLIILALEGPEGLALGLAAEAAEGAGAAEGVFIGYHGTDLESALDIMRRGVTDEFFGANFSSLQLGEGFYVAEPTANGLNAARTFARVAARETRSSPAILKVYARGFENMVGRDVPSALWEQVPGNFVTKFDYLTAPIKGLEYSGQIKFNPQTLQSLYTKLLRR
jgi:hypothetical protein